MAFTFKKSERINSQILIEKLFGGGNTAMSVFPLRAIFMIDERNENDSAPVRILISVPKKRFRHAVDRNRMKRLIREAYRLNKQELWDRATKKNKVISIAFVCITDELADSSKIRVSMTKILGRINDKLARL